MDDLRELDAGALDRSLDPGDGVGGEAEAALGIEAVDRREQRDVALRDQVHEGDAVPDELQALDLRHNPLRRIHALEQRLALGLVGGAPAG